MKNLQDLIFEVVNQEDESVTKYRFTCLKFNMDNIEYDASEVLRSSNFEVMAKLVQMKSGILERCD